MSRYSFFGILQKCFNYLDGLVLASQEIPLIDAMTYSNSSGKEQATRHVWYFLGSVNGIGLGEAILEAFHVCI